MPLASLLPLGIIMGAIGVCGTLLSVIPYATRGEVRARTHARVQARRGHAHAEAAIRGVRSQRMRPAQPTRCVAAIAPPGTVSASAALRIGRIGRTGSYGSHGSHGMAAAQAAAAHQQTAEAASC